jgi:hypothetical protein
MSEGFARWEDYSACTLEQKSIGHDSKSASIICDGIQARAKAGLLYKSTPPLEIIKSAGSELIVGGYATWELVDPEKDLITTKAMVNYLRKFFALPAEYRNIQVDHGNFNAGKALLNYTTPEGKSYYSHVNEKGLYLVSKVRNEDGLHRTTQVRQDIKQGIYRMYSIAGQALNPSVEQVDGEQVRKIDDIDPYETSYVKEGMNPRAEFQVLAKTQNEIRKPNDDRPPAAWWDACKASGKSDELCGYLFYTVLGGDRGKADPSMFNKGLGKIEDAVLFESLMRKHFPDRRKS